MPEEYRQNMRSYRSGRLGEAYCREHFGIGEPHYEIKSSGARTNSVVLQACQLLDQLHKQYVIVSYHRKERSISRGPRKGQRVFDDTVEDAYQRKVDVFVVRGTWLMEQIVALKLPMHCTAKNKSVYLCGKWGLVYRFPKSQLPRNLFEETEQYRLYCSQTDPPAWTEAAAVRPGNLFDLPREEPREPTPF